jgi:hypothetical protein
VNTAVEWRHQAPRKAALERLTVWGEIDRAEALAASDPDATIRGRGRKRHADVPAQGNLFD